MSRKLTPHQIDMLTRLAFNKGDVTIPHAIYCQDARTANSLKRRFNIKVTRVTKLPGAKFSYGYRALRLQTDPNTLTWIEAALRAAGGAAVQVAS